MVSLKLSAVIIAYNEGRNIARCIRSLQRVADEVVVVDSYSTDNTQQIARSLGAWVVEHPFSGFTDQKNFALTQARFDLILSLDADEYLSDTLVESILKIKQQSQADGYTFNRLNHFKGRPIKSCGWYPDAKIRLWDRRKGRWVGDLVHEVVALRNGGVQKHLAGDLMHDSYRSVAELLGKMQKYSDLYAKQHAFRKKVSTFKIFYKTFAAFFKNYILQRGMFDGYSGLVIAASNANNVFYKYAKLQELNRMASVSVVVLPPASVEMLKTVLVNVRQQSVLPQEVIVAGNAQSGDIQKLMDTTAGQYPVPLTYVESVEGSAVRKAIDQAGGAYILTVDSKAPLQQHGIDKHQRNALKGRFIHDSTGISFWKEDVASLTALGENVTGLITSLRNAGLKLSKR